MPVEEWKHRVTMDNEVCGMEARVKIVGNNRLLMHRCTVEAVKQSAKPKTGSGRKRTVKDEAYFEAMENEWKKTCMFDEKVGLFIPSEYIEANLRDAGLKIPVGRGSLKAEASRLVVAGDKIPMRTIKSVKRLEDIEKLGWIDERVVRIPPRTGSRVPKKRVCIPDPWELEFTVLIPNSSIDIEMLRKLFEAGGKIGLGDWRPKFGTYDLVSIKEVKEA